MVVGGDFHGLGITRSLGSRGIPICVVDDEYSIARFSKYTTFTVRPPTLRKELETVDFLVEMGQRMNLKGWVLFPTRDEHVAAFSRHKQKLSEVFRGPNAGLGNHKVGLEQVEHLLPSPEIGYSNSSYLVSPDSGRHRSD